LLETCESYCANRNESDWVRKQHQYSTSNVEKPSQSRSSTLRYETNYPRTEENSPDELGQTKKPSEKTNNVLIYSSSIAKKVNIKTLERKYSKGSVELHGNPGQNVTSIAKFARVHLEKEEPGSYNTVMLIAGGNDLRQGQKTSSKELSYIANTVIDHALGYRLRHGIEHVCISSILPRRDIQFQVSRHKLNDMLRSACEENGFYFMENDNIILKNHIQAGDGVHLNDEGNYLLEGNILDVLWDMGK
jgi:hypothetical protein